MVQISRCSQKRCYAQELQGMGLHQSCWESLRGSSASCLVLSAKTIQMSIPAVDHVHVKAISSRFVLCAQYIKWQDRFCEIWTIHIPCMHELASVVNSAMGSGVECAWRGRIHLTPSWSWYWFGILKGDASKYLLLPWWTQQGDYHWLNSKSQWHRWIARPVHLSTWQNMLKIKSTEVMGLMDVKWGYQYDHIWDNTAKGNIHNCLKSLGWHLWECRQWAKVGYELQCVPFTIHSVYVLSASLMGVLNKSFTVKIPAEISEKLCCPFSMESNFPPIRE